MDTSSEANVAAAVVEEARSDGLHALAERMLTRCWPAADADLPAPEDATTAVVLRLDDLVSDPSGEIVLSIDGAARQVILESPSEVADRGIKAPHSMLGGDNVQGMGYVAFHEGPTVFFPLDVLVTVGPPEG